jgi:N-acyl-D-aspartate/D-glutamate deacylase
MSHDLVIRNGTVVDGTGKKRFAADVAITAGKIVEIGKVAGRGREEIDATGLIVAPGFIDCHTHYDAQVFWDPTLSPSCFHGVTTVVGGFCGFSIAPVTPESAAYIRPMLARVEGMPLETLEQAVPWGSWSSFGEFLDQMEGKIGLNAGFFCGHSALRRIAMGKRAVGKRSTGEELEHMKKMLGESLAEGALGFSTTISPTHNDGDGNPVPSRWADFSELVELARVVRDYPGTSLELLPDLEFDPEIVELLTNFSLAGNRPVNWNVMMIMGDPKVAAEKAQKMLRATDYARARGAEVLALTVPGSANLFVNLANGAGMDSMPGLWREIFKIPLAERIAKFKDPDVRRQLNADAESMPAHSPLKYKTNFAGYLVVNTGNAKNKALEGRRSGDIAKERGCTPLDVMLDVAIDDNLATIFSPDTAAESKECYEVRANLWRDDRTLIGASDAGAHLDMLDTFAFSTNLLQRGVREHGVITLEDAVHLTTDRLARYFGFIDRGRIATGYNADLVIFDEKQVGRGPTYSRHDVPGGAFRLYADAAGIPHVFVNGVQIVKNGEHTGTRPGKVLRSGKDTYTVAMDALQQPRQAAE